MKNFLFSGVFVVAVFFLSGSTAAAQVSYSNYTPTSQSEMIAYLQGIIAQLQAQLQYRVGNTSNTTGQVAGATYRPSSSVRKYPVRAGTGFVYFDGDEVSLNGTLDLEGAPYVYAWFEYGEDDDFGDRTRRVYATRDQRFIAELDADDLDYYLYYRAVVEGPNGERDYGRTRAVYIGNGNPSNSRSRSNDDEPDADTRSARDIDDDSAELRGEVDMNDFRNGLVFFVYGEDEDEVEDVDREDEYRDIRERGDDLQKIVVDSDLDDDDDYERRVNNLDDNTDYYFRICVEYEDDDDDETLECGNVEDFETDRN